jgi:hypothetical protein
MNQDEYKKQLEIESGYATKLMDIFNGLVAYANDGMSTEHLVSLTDSAVNIANTMKRLMAPHEEEIQNGLKTILNALSNPVKDSYKNLENFNSTQKRTRAEDLIMRERAANQVIQRIVETQREGAFTY